MGSIPGNYDLMVPGGPWFVLSFQSQVGIPKFSGLGPLGQRLSSRELATYQVRISWVLKLEVQKKKKNDFISVQLKLVFLFTFSFKS